MRQMKGAFFNSVLIGIVCTSFLWVLCVPKQKSTSSSSSQVQARPTKSMSSRRASFPLYAGEKGYLAEPIRFVASLETLSKDELRQRLASELEKAGVFQDLTFEQEALFIRYAQKDPKAAFEWIDERWPNDYSEPRSQAWKVIAAEWAHQDSHDFLEQLEEISDFSSWSRKNRFKLKIARELLLFGDLTGWLSLYIETNNNNQVESTRFLSSIQTAEECRYLLEFWESYEKGNPNVEKNSRSELAQELRDKWETHDPGVHPKN